MSRKWGLFVHGANCLTLAPSPGNQRIEAWWGFFKKSNAIWWITFFEDMVEGRLVDLTSELEMECHCFCFSKLLQNVLDEVKVQWNTHRIRRSRVDTMHGSPIILPSP